jgi:hypothetical protein
MPQATEGARSFAMRVMTTAMILVITSTAIAASAAIRRAGSGSILASGSARIVFLNDVGRVTRDPVLNASDLYPGMEPRRILIMIANRGIAPVEFELELVLEGGRTGASLLDAIHVRVTDGATRTQLYRGAASGLRFAGVSPLGSQEHRDIAVILSWPDGAPASDRTMGASAVFSFVATAWTV